MSGLPKGWKSTELESLLSFVLGGDWGKAPDFSEEGYLDAFCIRGTEFKHWKKDKGITSVQRKLKASSLESRTLQLNDILIEISGGGPDQPVGRTVLIDKEALQVNSTYPKVCTNFIRLARPSCQVYAPYLNHYLHFFYLSGEVTKYQGGSNNLRNLKFKEYSKIEIPVPPYNEQIRIANKLDSILVKVDKAQVRLDQIPLILKRFRQSVLAAATSGELTKEWREERSLLFSDWREFGFSELLFKIRSGSGSKPVDESENGIRILRSSAVRNLAVNYNDHRYLPDNSEIKELDYLSNDDLLFTRLSGSLEYVGNCARVQGIEENTVQYPDRLFCAKLKDPKQSKYLEMYFSSPMFSKYIAASIKSSAGHQRITLGVIKDAKVIIPSEAEQEIIVGRVNKLFAKASRIEKQYLDAKARLDRLTQSILAKAFRGELVPQDPNDEPAEKLLERIVAEKEQNKSKKTTRKRTTKAKTAEKE